MNFYVLVGRRANVAVRSLVLDKDAQDDLTEMFERLADEVLAGKYIAFEPGYRADEGEIVTIAPYEAPSPLAPLTSAAGAADIPRLSDIEIASGEIRSVVGVEWKGKNAHQMVFQRVDSRYILRRENRRLMLAGNRFVRDERPGIEVTERIDAVLKADTLYISSWSRAHAVLDLSAWLREATIAETIAFVNQQKFSLPEQFEVTTMADTSVRRKIASISQNRVLERATPQILRKYAAKFGITIKVADGKIVLPADKKDFKRVLNLLDEDLLSFEPTDEHWVANSKRRASQKV